RSDQARRSLRRSRLATRPEDEDFGAQTVPLHPLAELGQRRRISIGPARGSKAFQPIYVATELTQPENVLEVDPEMASAFRESRGIVGGEDDGRHRHSFGSSSEAAGAKGMRG